MGDAADLERAFPTVWPGRGRGTGYPMTQGAAVADAQVNLAHLQTLSGPHGLFEHAVMAKPRVSHGYTTDDNGRCLVITAGMTSSQGRVLFERSLDFLARGFTPRGWRNRMAADGRWLDRLGSEDAHGRAVWGLGHAAKQGNLPRELHSMLNDALGRPLTAPRAVAYALIGASGALAVDQLRDAARHALADLTPVLPRPRPGPWEWPEDRLTYDNARIPQAMILAGDATGDLGLTDLGLDLLRWLVETEWAGDHFSFTPVGGRGRGETGPAFDQQPLEAWAMADACLLAADLTGDVWWSERAVSAVGWFGGENDGGVVMYDPVTGACFDGLEADGVNRNCGSESTLAALAAMRLLPRLKAGFSPSG